MPPRLQVARGVAGPKQGVAYPTTLEQLRLRLEAINPSLELRNPARPVVLLADVGGLRPLAFDADVHKLFASLGDASSSVAIEVRMLFPEAGAHPLLVQVPLVVMPPPSSAPSSPARQPPGSMQPSSPQPPSQPPSRQPVRRPPSSPPSLRKARPVSAPAERCGKAAPFCPPGAVSQPLQSSPLLVDAGFRRPLPKTPPYPPHPAKYDSRPGRWLDSEWAGMTATGGATGTVSAHMLEAFGLRDEYERLRVTSLRRRAALQKLLEVRDSVPSCHMVSRSISARSSTAKASQGEACIATDAEKRARMMPNNWEEGEFTPIAGRDVAKLAKVIESLQAIEGDAAARLQDDEVRVTWRILDARKLLADERRLAHGRLSLSPKRVLMESPWLTFGNLGSLIFRIYPRGDGSALSGGATVFMWMARTPGVSFSFNLELGRAARQQEGGKLEPSGTCFATAPRLWQADMVHYRMDICWSEVAALLTDMTAEERLDITFNVLQWHIIRSPEDLETERDGFETTVNTKEVVQ